MRAPTAGGPGAEVTQAGELRSARIESLRAIAALGVLLGHEFVVARGLRFDSYLDRVVLGGGFGVDLFFALTGYLLFWPFARRLFGDGPRVDLRRYALNRALRILPLYYVVVVVALVLQEGGGTLGQWGRFLTFTEGFSNATLLRVDGVVWSLVVELHFYVLLAFLAWGLARLAGGSVARAALLLLALGAASLLVQAAFVGFGTPRDPILAYALPARFFFFVPGMLLALLRLWPPQRLPRADLWLLGAAALWLVVFRDYRWAPLAVLPCFLMVGAAVLPPRPGPLVRALEWRPLALGGDGLVLAVPVARADPRRPRRPVPEQVLVGTPVCLAVAFVSYRLVEAPFLRQRKRWEGGPRRITAEPPPGWREESRPTEAAGSPVAPA
jgi:peptidoglycan/LPS O-acetylase OafA/YrhL